MAEYTLLVIDMQGKIFPASLEPGLIANVTREIVLAREARCPIVFFTIPYDPFQEDLLDPTLPELTDLVRGYELVEHVSKSPTDPSAGARCLRNFARDLVLRAERHFRLVGVKTNLCVFQMADTLTRPTNFPDWTVECMQDACGTEDSGDPWQRFRDELPHVILTPTRALEEV